MWEAAKEDSQHGRPALTEVVRRYWQPLYLYARKQGMNSQDAEDATQEFLSRVMDGKLLDNADPAKGRFRSYLLVAWKRFLVDQYRKESAEKRGGHTRPVSLDVGTGEQNWLALQSREPDADRMFMRGWANSLLAESRQRLRQDYYARNKSELIEALLPNLSRALTAEDYESIAQGLSTTPGALKVALHRLRQKFGETLRRVVSETLDDGSDIDQELADLLDVLKSPES